MSESSVCQNSQEVAAVMRNMAVGENTWRMEDGIVFEINKSLQNKYVNVVNTICQKLGPKASHEKNISNSLWKSTAKRIIDRAITSDEAAKTFLKDIEQASGFERRYIHLNSLIGREPGVDKLRIGPVEIIDGSCVAEQLNANRSADRWLAEVREPGIKHQESRLITVDVPINCWMITIAAARENLREEAAWLAGIATSLLKLTARPSLGHFIGDLGTVEPHPFKTTPVCNDGITVDKDGVSTGGLSLLGRYVISEATIAYCGSNEFQLIADQIFTPPNKSLAERVSQGLGWLARGRQSEDRAERFLFFFTALEALLSNEDKAAPVVQTIARHAASILTDCHEDRAKNAKLIRDLYALRSALVHSGMRKVSMREANTAENIAHILFGRVLDQCNLAEQFKSFQKKLSDCSYGLPWGNDETHRLGPTPDWPVFSHSQHHSAKPSASVEKPPSSAQ